MENCNLTDVIPMDDQIREVLQKLEEGGANRDKLSLISDEVIRSVYSVAYVYYEKGFYTKAEEIFYFLVGARMRSSVFWMGLGAVLQVQKKYAEAVEAYERAAIYDFKMCDPFPHFHAAECLYSLKKVKRAVVALNSAKTIALKVKTYPVLLKRILFLIDVWNNKIKGSQYAKSS